MDKRPFKPFRIRLQDGRAFKVAKANLCTVAVKAVYIGVPDPKPRGCVRRVDYCPNDYSVPIEPLNGKRRRTARGKHGKTG